MEANESSTQVKSPDCYGELRTICYKYKKRSTTHVSSGNTWISQLISENSFDEPVHYQIRKQLKVLAQRIHNDDLEAHQLVASKHGRYENKDFHKALLSYGTTKDKMAAYMYKCMEHPVYTVNELFSLIDFVNPNNKSCSKAIGEIASVFETVLLPNGHVAKEFECHNFMSLTPFVKTNFEQVEKQLVLWYFEDQVHLAYLKFLENIEKLCYDTQAKVKSAGAKGFRDVFKNHPKQDTELVLQKLVNKLGDSNKVTKGLVLHILTNIQHDYPALKITLISLVEEFLHRPNVSSNGQYAGLCLLRDVVLSNYDDHVAEKLLKIYFDFFEMCSKKGEVDSRFMATILRGLNRAYPYLKEKRLPSLDKQMEILYKLCHYVNFNVGTQALQLIYQVQSYMDDTLSDRFYTIIYDKLLDTEFGTSSFKSAFLNLIFRSMVKDNNRSRICAFIRRLLQVSKYHPSEVASGVLFLISETVKDNLVLKKDIFSFLMTGNNNNTNIKIKPEGAASASVLPSDDENEYYSDLDTDDEEEDDKLKAKSDIISSRRVKNKFSKSENHSRISDADHQRDAKSKSESSWVHKENWGPSNIKHEVRTKKYETNIRNPLYCGADLLPFWELVNFKHHFHPTVSLFATQLLDQIFVEYSGDPLEDLSLTRFLNRFVQRNPKKIKPEKNKIGAIFGSRSTYVPQGTRNIDISSNHFKMLNQKQIAPEDVFLHRYFTEYRKEKEVIKKRKRTDSDDEDADDDLFDKFLRKKMSGLGDLGDDDEEGEDADIDFASKMAVMDEEDSVDDDEDEDDDREVSKWENDIGSDEELEEFNSKSENVSSGEDEDDDFGSEEDFGSEGFDEFSDDEEASSVPSVKQGKAKLIKKSSGNDWQSKLVDADEVAHWFEENDAHAGTSEAVLNKDKSHAKQLKWEQTNRSGSYKKHFKGAKKPRMKFGKEKKNKS